MRQGKKQIGSFLHHLQIIEPDNADRQDRISIFPPCLEAHTISSRSRDPGRRLDPRGLPDAGSLRTGHLRFPEKKTARQE
jgi:hypothetical protein